MQGIEQSFVNRRPLHIVPRILDIEYTQAGKDPNVLVDQIAAFKSKIEDLIAEVYQLNIEKQNDKDEHRVLMNKMEQDHQKYCHQIEHYNSNILNLEENEKKEEIIFSQNVERERKNAENLHGVEVASLSKRLQDLETQYLQLKKFEELQKQYNAKIVRLKAAFVEEQYKHHDAMNQKERFQKEQTVNAQLRNEAETKKVLKQVHKQAKSKVINEHKQAMGQKMELKTELLALQKELQKLKKISTSITAKNKQTKIKATINIQSLQEYRAVGALQIAKIKSFKQKAEDVKFQISSQSEKMQKQLAQIKSQNDSKLQQLKRTYKSTKKQKIMMQKQLQNIKLLASRIIEQRVELEQFFTSAMVKLQKQAIEKNLKPTDKVYGDKVDVTDLDVLDKQKILKTLLSKISMGGKNDAF